MPRPVDEVEVARSEGHLAAVLLPSDLYHSFKAVGVFIVFLGLVHAVIRRVDRCQAQRAQGRLGGCHAVPDGFVHDVGSR